MLQPINDEESPSWTLQWVLEKVQDCSELPLPTTFVSSQMPLIIINRFCSIQLPRLIDALALTFYVCRILKAPLFLVQLRNSLNLLVICCDGSSPEWLILTSPEDSGQSNNAHCELLYVLKLCHFASLIVPGSHSKEEEPAVLLNVIFIKVVAPM